MKYLIVFISFLLDLIICNFIRNGYPLFTIVSISFISKFYKKKEFFKYYIFVLIISTIYDTLITNNFFLTLFLFFSISFISIYLSRILKDNFINNIIKAFFTIVIYNLLFYLVLVIIKYYYFDINLLINKIYNSILLSLIYASILFFVLKKDKH